MASNLIPKINNENEIVGVTTITKAIQNGWPRRVTRIIISNEKGQFLLQKRSMESKIHPGVWDCSGGHVDVDESYTEAGAREVFEELGVNVVVTEASDPILFEDTFYVVCVAKLHTDMVLALKTDEVTEVKWVAKEELMQLLKMHPGNFTPWVLHIWENFENKLSDTV